MPPNGSKRVVIWCGLASLFVAGLVQADDLSDAVRIGEMSVPAPAVLSALGECTRNQPSLPGSQCLERYFAPRFLLDREARERRLETSPAMKSVHATLLATRLGETIESAQPRATEGEVDAYLQKHARDFEKPLRIRIFRILFDKESDAKELIQKLDERTTVEQFRAFARDLSVDQATHERGGDLGFVWPDGSTDVPQVSAEKSLYEAALGLADGEFKKEPVQEGSRFAVIWRRGSLPALTPGEDSRKLARLALLEKRTEDDVNALLTRLQKSVSVRNHDLLGKIRRKEATLFDEP